MKMLDFGLKLVVGSFGFVFTVGCGFEGFVLAFYHGFKRLEFL